MNYHEFVTINEDDFIELYRNFSDEQRTELHKNLERLGYNAKNLQYFIVYYSKFITTTKII